MARETIEPLPHLGRDAMRVFRSSAESGVFVPDRSPRGVFAWGWPGAPANDNAPRFPPTPPPAWPSMDLYYERLSTGRLRRHR
jgi:hypothetical protein